MIWMAVTPDELELPIATGRTAGELAKTLQVTVSTVRTLECRRRQGKYKYNGKPGDSGMPPKYKIYKVDEI